MLPDQCVYQSPKPPLRTEPENYELASGVTTPNFSDVATAGPAHQDGATGAFSNRPVSLETLYRDTDPDKLHQDVWQAPASVLSFMRCPNRESVIMAKAEWDENFPVQRDLAVVRVNLFDFVPYVDKDGNMMDFTLKLVDWKELGSTSDNHVHVEDDDRDVIHTRLTLYERAQISDNMHKTTRLESSVSVSQMPSLSGTASLEKNADAHFEKVKNLKYGHGSYRFPCTRLSGSEAELMDLHVLKGVKWVPVEVNTAMKGAQLTYRAHWRTAGNVFKPHTWMGFCGGNRTP